MADIPRADLLLWREYAQNAWPTGTFARYLNRSPLFLAKKFGSDPIEEWQLAAKFAEINAGEGVLRPAQANYIYANQNAFGQQLRGALVNQQALNLLVTNCPEIELGGNAGLANLGAEMALEADLGDDGLVLQGPQRRQRIGPENPRDPEDLYGGDLAFRQALWNEESLYAEGRGEALRLESLRR